MKIFTGVSHWQHTISNLTYFANPLSSYKQKDNLISLSGVLGLKMMGTVSELGSQLKAHLSSHPELQGNPHFSELFLNRWC